MTETWFHPLFTEQMAAINGFNTVRNDRIQILGGGVALYIKNNLTYKILAFSKNHGNLGLAEYLICEVNLKPNQHIFVAVVYRPPNSPFYKGNDFLEVISNLSLDYSNKLILGDFNCNMLNLNPQSSIIFNFLKKHNLSLINHGVTHISETSQSHIDLCIIDENDTVINIGKSISPFIHYHYLISATIKLIVPSPTKSIFTYRKIDQIDKLSFSNKLMSYEWDNLNHYDDPDEILKFIEANIISTLDYLAPEITITATQYLEPWINPHLNRIRRDCDRLYRKYRRANTQANLDKYRASKKYLHHSIYVAKTDFYRKRLTQSNNPNKLWVELRHLGLADSSNYTEPIFSPDTLNDYYSSVQYRDENPLTHSQFDFEVPSNINHFFNFSTITVSDLTKAINHFTSKSVGVDGISLKILHLCLPDMAPSIIHLFNRSISNNIFPSRWKFSLILPINKVNAPSVPADYRPISLQCTLSKIFEKILFDQIYEYLSKNSILDQFQSGFQKNLSTETALAKLIDDIKSGTDKKLVTLLVLFDFSKAFDRVSHTLILSKLRECGFSPNALRWFNSYLDNRYQSVLGKNRTRSKWNPIASGVPQGSVLGPLLFLIFINDLKSQLKYSFRLLYADDLQIYIQSNPAQILEAIRKIEIDISGILKWSDVNKMNINHTKTQAIIFGPKADTELLLNSEIKLSVGKYLINMTKSVKNLGIQMDYALSWSDQIKKLSRTINFILYRLRFFRHLTDLPLCKQLVTSLIFPHIDYCSAALGELKVTQIATIHKLMNSCIRYIFGLNIRQHITPHRLSIGWLSVANRRKYLSLCFIYKILNTGKPPYLRDKIKLYEPARPLRQTDRELDPPISHYSCYDNSLFVSTTREWNFTPLHIRHSSTLKVFKNCLHSHLLKSELNHHLIRSKL